MIRILSFEAELWATLDLIPLRVRRLLDEAGVKLSLGGWQSLPLADRRWVAELDDDAFAPALKERAARAGIALTPIAARGVAVSPIVDHPWREAAPPTIVVHAASARGTAVDASTWASLDLDARFTLHHLAAREAKSGRDAEDRFGAALRELGVLA